MHFLLTFKNPTNNLKCCLENFLYHTLFLRGLQTEFYSTLNLKTQKNKNNFQVSLI